MQAVTIRQVAEHAQVSLGTVSNVLNRPEMVAEATRSRVQRAISDLGFVRNAGAASLRTANRTAVVGLVVPDVANPYFTEMARGVEDGANGENRLVILCNSDDDPRKEDRYLDLLEEQRVLGVLISSVREGNSRLRRLVERGTAVVLLERQQDGYCSVGVDSVAGGGLAAAHLLGLGHTRLAVVTGSMSMAQYRDRLQGVHRAMHQHGRDASDLHLVEVPGLGDTSAGHEAATALLSLPDPPTGIVCGNDLLALGVVSALLQQGVRIPQDASVVGYDDINVAVQGPLPLTTVSQPARHTGMVAARLLLAEAEEGRAHKHRSIIFSPELVVRATTAGPP